MAETPALPTEIADSASLDELLSEPTRGVVEMFRQLEGDVVVLGAAGKMGPTLAAMVKRASDLAGSRRRVIGVSRFSAAGSEAWLNDRGVQTIAADLLDDEQLARLPDAPNVIY